jgi:hypothetical protein
MPSLLGLPEEVLSQIAEQSLCLGAPDAPINSRRTFRIKERVFHEHAERAAPVIPLLLTCRRLNAIASSLLLSRAVFSVCDTRDLRHLVESMGGSRLSQVRNFSVILYSDDDYEHDPRDDETAQEDIEEATELLEQLPSKLHRLCLQMPFHSYPPFSYNRGTDIRLRQAMDKFAGLEELRLDFFTHYVHIDMFTNMTANAYATFHEWVEPPAPKFPLLRRLHLEGCLTPLLGPKGLATALSESQLPCLEALIFEGILHDSDDEDSLVFEPEALTTMHPLHEFCWVPYDFDEGIRKTLGNPHSPPTRRHLDELKARHGATLRVLRIDFGERESCMGPWELDIDQGYLDEFKEAMPNLSEVSLEMGNS